MGSTVAGPESRTRLMLGALAGAGAAAAVGFGWFLASVGTKSNQTYLAVGLAIAVGYAVHVVSHQRGVVPAVIAMAITAVGTAVAFYFVSRSGLIRKGFVRLTGDDERIPLLPTYTVARDIMRVTLKGNLSPYLYLVASLAASGYFGYRGVDTAKRPRRA